VGLDAARARIESILGRRVNLSVSTYVPGGTGDNRSHVGSRFAAGQTKQVVPGQVWTPDVPGRLSSVEESQRMTSSASSGRVPLVIQLMDGAMVRRRFMPRQMLATRRRLPSSREASDDHRHSDLTGHCRRRGRRSRVQRPFTLRPLTIPMLRM